MERLGSGGFGVVYLAEERKTGIVSTLLTLYRLKVCSESNTEEQSSRL